MAETYNKTPSEIMGIDDPYTAYCFDEAALYIIAQRRQNNEPQFSVEEISKSAQHFSSFTELSEFLGK